MSPRISFSNDFVESSSQRSQQHLARASRAPPSTDFEFSVSNNSMLTADELFFKGRLLPFKDEHRNNGNMQRTLRDELLVDDEINFSLKPPKSSSSTTNRLKGFLGLRKSKKSEKSGSFDDTKRFSFFPDNANLPKISEGTENCDGCSSSIDMEMET